MGAANRYGRVSLLSLDAVRQGDATVLAHVETSAPYRVMRPFTDAEPGGFARVITMSSSAGLLAGDEQRVRVHVGPAASLSVRAQAYEKVHRMEGDGTAVRGVALKVEPEGRLMFAQQPVIPYAGSKFSGTTRIDLADASASLLYSEVICCGRVARGERFAYTRFSNRVQIRVGERLRYADNLVLDPARADLAGMGMFEGFTHLASLVAIGPHLSEEAFERAREQLALPVADGTAAGGITHLGDAGGTGAASGSVGWAVRLLGLRAQDLEEALAEVARAAGFTALERVR